MLLLLHSCRPRCHTLCADVVFTCLVKWWDGNALGNSKKAITWGHFAASVSKAAVALCWRELASVKYSLEAAPFLD